jgi:hypothetical protein
LLTSTYNPRPWVLPALRLFPPAHRELVTQLSLSLIDARLHLYAQMELYFHDLSYRAKLADVERVFAKLLHGPRYLPQSQQPWNFRVYLFPPKRNQPGQDHMGCGTVTLPEKYLGESLLLDTQGLASLKVRGKTFKVKRSKGAPNAVTLEKLRREPYISSEHRQRRTAIQGALK